MYHVVDGAVDRLQLQHAYWVSVGHIRSIKRFLKYVYFIMHKYLWSYNKFYVILRFLQSLKML